MLWTKLSVLLMLLPAALIGLHAPSPTVTAYYAGNASGIDRYNLRGLTHIIYSFCHLKGSELVVDNAADSASIKKLVSLKRRHPKLKVLLSLGGWGGCATCSDAFATDSGRKSFAASVERLHQYFGTDGLDLDWEYPAIEGYPEHKYTHEDKRNFTALIQALRDRSGRKYEVTFAAGGFKKFIEESVEWDKVMPMVDRVNVMTYDLVNGYAKATGHHTALYSTPQQTESTDNAVNLLLQKGVPADKIVVGAAFYARVWEGVPATAAGLYGPGTFKKSVAWRDFAKELAAANGYVYHWDDTAKAPWYYSAKEKTFATFDDARSLEEKVGYVKQKGLNGIMFWELSLDTANGGLLQAISGAVNK